MRIVDAHCHALPHWFEPIPPLMAIESFGSERVMRGSDFPRVAGREGYRNALHWTLEHLSFCDNDAKTAIFAGTATRVFQVGGPHNAS